jgi:hypothetical protein
MSKPVQNWHDARGDENRQERSLTKFMSANIWGTFNVSQLLIYLEH